MNTFTQETPHFHRLNQPAVDAFAKGEGSKLHSTYFEFHVTLPVVIGAAVSEMSDAELLVAVEKAGTFDFLDAAEEDGYNDLLPPRE